VIFLKTTEANLTPQLHVAAQAVKHLILL